MVGLLLMMVCGAVGAGACCCGAVGCVFMGLMLLGVDGGRVHEQSVAVMEGGVHLGGG